MAAVSREAGATLSGLCFLDGALVLKVGRARCGPQIRIAAGEAFDDAEGGLMF